VDRRGGGEEEEEEKKKYVLEYKPAGQKNVTFGDRKDNRE